VQVLDRQPEAGLETSFANGGQISVSHAEPWANPGAPLKILHWLGHEDAPLLFRPSADLRQWLWGVRFLAECLPWRSARNTSQAFSLARYSREQLVELRRVTRISYDESTRGILQFFTSERDFERAHRQVEKLNQRGFDAQARTPAQCVAIEPALAHAAKHIAGGVFTASDESGDARLFTAHLAERARAASVAFRFNVNVRCLDLQDGRVCRVVIDDEAGAEESVRADAYVVALGSYSPLVLRPLGIHLPVYPVKGYSITIPLGPGDEAPRVSLSDDSHKIVFSRLGERLRVAGTAELNGYDTAPNPVRSQALIDRTFELFPRAGRREDAQLWCGLRPATPSNLPRIGRSRYANLYLNTGHGTLGWTMACGSGAALADIISGRRPAVDFDFLGMDRGPPAGPARTAPRPTGS
jgi:D-amino-acid dehydrogenase